MSLQQTLEAQLAAERRMPPHPRGVVEILRERGHMVKVRENRYGSLRYTVDGSREMNALQMTNKYRKAYGV